MVWLLLLFLSYGLKPSGLYRHRRGLGLHRVGYNGRRLWRPKTGASDAFQLFRVSPCDVFVYCILLSIICIASCHQAIFRFSPTTGRLMTRQVPFGFIKTFMYNYTRWCDKYPDNMYIYTAKTGPTSTPTSRVPLPSTWTSTKTCTTTVATWTTTSTTPCTTTSSTKCVPPQNACFKGIIPRWRPPVYECVLYEMHPMFGPCPNCSLHVRRKPCHRYVGHPESGITPPSCMTRSRSLPFAPVSPWATGTDMLPWHHFRICCRGILFGYVAVAPFLFRRRGTFFLPPWRLMPRIMLMSTFS